MMSKLNRLLAMAMILMGSIVPSSHSVSAVEIDRLLAAVNGKVITDTDLGVTRVLNALLRFGRGGSDLSLEEELDRLIDVELIRQELESFPLVPSDESDTQVRMQELRRGYAEIGGLTTLLGRLGLREEELESYVRLQAVTSRFINLRFRPFANVAADEIRLYYAQRLTPQLRRAGAEVPPLEDVSAQIEEILIEERVNDALDRWILNVRRHSRIELFLDREPGGKEVP